MFKSYIHVEKYGNDEVQGIELGKCYIFPKLDGTNASVWYDGEVKAGSRKRELSADADNAGFYHWATKNDNLAAFFKDYPDLRLYGEWLCPHSLKTYRNDAWRRFYIFDVQQKDDNKYIHFDDYKDNVLSHNLDIIEPISIFTNATYDSLICELEKNIFLIEDGKGVGEGIVIKNYDYQNKFGRNNWAKIVTNEFKEKHTREMGAPEKENKMVEQAICDEFVTKSLVDKVYAKIVNEMEGWNSKYIPRLLSTVYYDLINEEMWNITKKHKNPTINFRTLATITTLKIKILLPELF